MRCGRTRTYCQGREDLDDPLGFAQDSGQVPDTLEGLDDSGDESRKRRLMSLHAQARAVVAAFDHRESAQRDRAAEYLAFLDSHADGVWRECASDTSPRVH